MRDLLSIEGITKRDSMATIDPTISVEFVYNSLKIRAGFTTRV